MSNLVLTRNAGKSVRLEMLPGVFVTLIVAYVGGDQVKLELVGQDGSCLSKRVDVGGFMEIGPDVKVHLKSINFRVARLLFEAPLNVKIARTELLNRGEVAK